MTELTPGAITTADLYRELVDMRVKLAIIETQTATADRVHDDHETRIRGVERFRWILFGASSAVGTLAGIIAALITSKGHA